MLSFMLFLLLAHARSVNPQQVSQKSIFLLAGQSNMAGRGGVVNNTLTGAAHWDGIVPPECRPNRRILRLTANLTWVEAHEPLHVDIDYNKTDGIGPGMAFANAVLTKAAAVVGVVGLVPCAVGGTAISEWRRGSFLYGQLVRRAQAAVEGGGMIRALLWYQGESDTARREDADSYKGKLEKFFRDIRSDLQSPMLPIIQVALASGQGPFVETVREAQLGIDLLNVRCVDAKGLPLGPDGLHLTTKAQVQLGLMLADAFLQSLPRPISSMAISSNAPMSFSNFFANFFIGPIIIFLWMIICVRSR